VGEKERWTARLENPALDGPHLDSGIDRRVDAHEFAPGLKGVEALSGVDISYFDSRIRVCW
jgi:hypothetical protein